MAKEKTTEEVKVAPPVKDTKEELLALSNKLKELGIHRISELENLIARCS